MPSSAIQAIRFKRKGWTKAAAEQWLRSHKKRPIKPVDVTAHELRYRLHEPEDFDHFATIKTKAGINLVIGYYGRRRRGKGLRDIWDNVTGRISGIFTGPREGPNPAMRKFLAEHGNHYITGITVCREPIRSAIDKAFNILSFGHYGRAKAAYGYDDLFHLYAYLDMNNAQGTDPHRRRVDKNHVVEISEGPETGECITVPMTQGPIRVAEFFARAIELQGPKEFWVYDPISANCQLFIRALLVANGLDSEQNMKFVYQPVDKLLPDYARRIGRKITDVLGIGDILLKGRGREFNDAANQAAGTATAVAHIAGDKLGAAARSLSARILGRRG